MTKKKRSKDRCEKARQAIEKAAEEAMQRDADEKLAHALKVALEPLETGTPLPMRPRVPIRVEVLTDHLHPNNRGDDFFEKDDTYSSWKEYADELSRRLSDWPHLPRKGDLIADEEDSLRVCGVHHDVSTGSEHITVFVGEYEEPYEERRARLRRERPLNVNVVLDEDHTEPAALEDEHYQPDYKGVDDYLDTLGTLLSRRAHPPQVGERISMWGRPHGPAWHVLRVDVELDPGEPENEMYGVYLGTQSEPITKPPAPAASSGERRVPEEIPGGYGRVLKTAQVIEDLDCEARLMHAQAKAMRLLLERDIREDKFRHHHHEFSEMLGYIEAELEVFRDRFGSMLKGYFGEDYKQH